MQEAVHNSLPILEEIIALTEQDEDETVKKEISKRRTRVSAPGLEELKKEVGREIWGASKVMSSRNQSRCADSKQIIYSSLAYTTRS